MCDALDRRLQRVRERELRDRVADDGEQRPAALELEPGVAGALGGTQGVGGPDGEAGELLHPVLVRRPADRKTNLERAQHGLAELERHDRYRSASFDGDSAGLFDDRVRRSGELCVGHDRPVGAGDLERPVTEPPHDRGVAARRDRRKARNSRRSTVVGGNGGEGVAGDVECPAAVPPRCDAALEQLGESERARPRAARFASPPGRTALPAVRARSPRRRLPRRTEWSSPRRFRRAVPERPSRRSRATRRAAPRSPRPDRRRSTRSSARRDSRQAPAARAPPRRPPTPVLQPPRAATNVCSIGAPAASERAACPSTASASATVLARLPIKVRRAARPRARSSASAAR